MPQKGQKTITISGKTLQKLEQKYHLQLAKQPSLSFASFIAESAIIELERRQILNKAQLISLVGFGEDIVILKDAKKENRLIEVQIRDKRLKCITEDKFDCIHVGFALALPEVRKALDK